MQSSRFFFFVSSTQLDKAQKAFDDFEQMTGLHDAFISDATRRSLGEVAIMKLPYREQGRR